MSSLWGGIEGFLTHSFFLFFLLFLRFLAKEVAVEHGFYVKYDTSPSNGAFASQIGARARCRAQEEGVFRK